jgi:hypothetical protein
MPRFRRSTAVLPITGFADADSIGQDERSGRVQFFRTDRIWEGGAVADRHTSVVYAPPLPDTLLPLVVERRSGDWPGIWDSTR